jgi:hypothetical protein
MKTRILFSLVPLLLWSVTLLGQTNIFPASGNVGIGTTNPSEELQIVKDGNIVNLEGFSYRSTSGGFGIIGYGARGTLTNPTTLATDDNTLWIRGMGYDGTDYHRVGHIGIKVESVSSGSVPGYVLFQTNDGEGTNSLVERMRITSTGNVGIGTSSPDNTLHIIADAVSGPENTLKIGVSDATSDYFQIKNSTSSTSQFIPTLKGYHVSDNREALYLTGEISSSNDTGTRAIVTFNARVSSASVQVRPLFKWSNYTSTKMILTSSGNLGIGTESPSEKLVVDGKILAEEVKVQAVPSSDYVFDSDYNLRSINEVENFITENKHLPDIPSAKEFKENGVGLGEMDNMLLRKVEELTLYMIDMQKQMDQLKEKNCQLRQMISDNR